MPFNKSVLPENLAIDQEGIVNVDQHLLTDEQMRRFIANGYLVLKTDFSAEFHRAMNAHIDEVMEREGNPGNNFLPRIPEAQAVFKHPAIRGALTSVLGERFVTHPHRHCHYTYPGRKVQSWHKDSYWGYRKVRNHHPWWAMIFYYPQPVDQAMGPSAVLPGTQYYDKRPGDDTEHETFVEGPQGTFILIHYDLWHRGSANNSDRTRAMMKFQFVRLDAPEQAAWQNTQAEWQPLNGDGPPTPHEAIWQHQWNWQSGRRNVVAPAQDDVAELPTLLSALQADYEPDGMDAAYRLAALNGSALPALQDALNGENLNAARRAGYGLTAAGESVTDGLVDALSSASESARGYAAFALGERQADVAVPALASLMDDESDWVRFTAAEALGIAGAPQAAVPGLIKALNDENDQVRFTSGLSLARIGADAAEAVPALVYALNDENRYVRANSAEALRQIGSPEALDAVLAHLMDTRWCYTTTPDNSF